MEGLDDTARVPPYEGVIDLVASCSMLGLLAFMVVGYTVQTLVKGRLQQKRLEGEGKLLGRTLMEGCYWLVQPLLNGLHAVGDDGSGRP